MRIERLEEREKAPADRDAANSELGKQAERKQA
jgi:hypothetical protein